MASRQLNTVLRVESDKEQQAAKQFHQAQQYLVSQQDKLKTLQQYRVDYIEQIKRSGSDGVDSTRYQQHLSFVGKLDVACEQQNRAISQASLVVNQRKRAWLKQQQRKQAIEKLIANQDKLEMIRRNRIEQAEMDEFANQQFLRRRV